MSTRRGMQGGGRLSGAATASSPPPMASVPGKRSVEDNGAEPAKKRIAAINDPLGAQLPAMEGGPPSSSRTRRGKTFGEVVPIPYGLVGLISKIQAETGCKVQVANDSRGGKDRPCYLEGTKDAIERAKNYITDIINSKSHEIGRSSSGPAHPKPNNGQASIEMVIPGAKISLVIGKDGETIRSLQDKSGTKMFVLQDYMFEDSDKTLRIVGHADLVDNAMQLVIDLIHESPPSHKSRKPNNQMKTGAKVQFDPIGSNLEDTDEGCVIITGKRTEELVETALNGGMGDNSGGRDQGEERRNGVGPAHYRARDWTRTKAMRSKNQQPSAALVNIDEESKYWFPCYECEGEKFEDIVKHRYVKHYFIKDCPFCIGVQFKGPGQVASHINRRHRSKTGFCERAATVLSHSDLEKLNLEQELIELKQSQDWKIVVKVNFAVLYDEVMHTPIVCIEHLTAANVQKNFRDDELRYYKEELLENNVCPQGFSSMKPPMHAGHLAARANHTNSKEAFVNTFSMVNIVPMDPNVNGGIWYQIETHSRKLLSNWHDVIVFSGPIYEFGSSIPLMNLVGLPIYAPTAFFKLLVMRRSTEEPKIQAFIVENDYTPTELFHHRATITDIAARTGLNLSKYERYAYTWDSEMESFICSKTRCFKTFVSQNDLDVHKRVPHCNICGHIFDQEADLIAHKESHPNLRCRVLDCTFICKRKFEMRLHTKQVHCSDRPFKCKFEGCGRAFKTKVVLQTHKRSFHHNERPWLCQKCGKAFHKNDHLKIHIEGVHNAERKYECQVKGCGRKFKTKDTMKSHVKYIHNAKREFKCDFTGCTKAFARKRQLNVHVKTNHSNEWKFICQVENCNKKYQCNSGLQAHIKSKHGEESFICPYPNCGKEYKYKVSLQRHVRKSHGGESIPDAEKKTFNNETRSGKENPTSNSTKKVARAGISKRIYVDESDEEK